MNFNKYFVFLAVLVLCLLGQQATEAHHHFGRIGHELEKTAKKVDNVVSKVETAKTIIAAGSALAEKRDKITMNFNKYFAFLAVLVLCLLGQQATEAHHHHHHFGRIGHDLRRAGHSVEKAAKKVDKIVSKVETAKTIIEAGSALAGAAAAAV
ncbi:hypothetical protein DOY81_008922 [Sarcophaga bullata]|nr:hypothetical protein DOY81_008922 [Sarcophaga bullata]